MVIIHFHKATGRIGAWGNADSEESHLPDHDIVRLDTNVAVDPKRHRIAAGELVEVDDLAAWNAPTEGDLAARIEMELAATDQFMMPDRNVPNRYAWVAYRQALRDLSKLKGAAAQLAAWPTRPDKKESKP